ncbi:hypothetical protein [Nocardioides sp. YR527]|uniref:hypothetical protein n=1 Tax=Nocardioides sp. YR527 TaxID=1881028 RepID=UPI0015A3B547|nr:hypothetical protein [Nocardioides sp. YR527]
MSLRVPSHDDRDLPEQRRGLRSFPSSSRDCGVVLVAAAALVATTMSVLMRVLTH